MTDFNPKVSIIIPIYNGSNYMREAIDSALAQTYKSIEIIVVNDGSDDKTEEIALSYGDKIRYFSKENGGQSSALNFGIEKMTSEYFSWLSHDDVYYPHKIEVQIACLSQLQNRSEAFIYSNWESIDKNSRHLYYNNQEKVTSSEFIYRMLVSIPVNGCTVLIHKKLMERAGYFNLIKPHTSDVELFLKLGLLTEPFHLPLILVKSRSHIEQATFRNRRQHIFESNLYGIDALNMIPCDILLRSSGLQNLSIVYKRLAILWAGRGLIYASNEAFHKFRTQNKFLFFNLYLRIICILNYLFRTGRRKIVKFLKRVINKYGMR